MQADTPLHRSSDISEPSLGFAARYASESLGPAIDGVIADSLTYMSSHSTCGQKPYRNDVNRATGRVINKGRNTQYNANGSIIPRTSI